MVNARIVVKAFQLTGRSNLEQVLVPLFVLCQQQQVITVFVALRVAVTHTPGGHVSLQPDNRFYPGLFGGMEELDHPEHGAMIGDGNRVHVHLFRPGNQLLDVAEAVQERIFGVNMKVGKGHYSRSSANATNKIKTL